MNTLQTKIDQAIKATAPRTPARRKALAGIKWRLRYGAIFAGYDAISGAYLLTTADQAVIFDGRDNEQIKKQWYEIQLGIPLEIEICS